MLLAGLTFGYSAANAKNKTKTMEIKIVETSDVHGSFFPYDFIRRKPKAGSLARVSTYINNLRKEHGENVLLLDNGDILQGQPICYFYNYINTKDENIAAKIINYMKYDAATIGNHDVETGHAVYDKWASEVKCPMLGANVIDVKTQKPYFLPYTVFERQGAKIAVIGMITPAIPNWLTENLWSGLYFEEMVKAAQRTMNEVKTKVKPDVIIGLFHSGKEGGIETAEYKESASIEVAKKVDGFDAVFFGHDHSRCLETITNDAGNEVLCLDPANNAMYVAQANLSLVKEKGKWRVAGFAEMAAIKGDKATANKYMAKAKEMGAKWEQTAREGDHYRLAFDRNNTWSQKYNMVWDKLWSTNVFPNNAMQKEIKYYLGKQNKYGLPLDSRKDYSKNDWIMWTAAMAPDNETFLKFVDPIWKYMNETESRVPTSDWYDTKTGLMQGFKARSVIGGFWMKVLADKLAQKNK